MNIHYCWYGKNPLSDKIKKCIDSWKKFFPRSEIICWNEDNSDFSDCPFAIEAYAARKWAFVSDYMRSKVLFEYGGLFLDTDVEMINDMESLMKDPFLGFELDDKVNPGLVIFADRPKLWLFEEVIQKYRSLSFDIDDLFELSSPRIYTDILVKHGLKKDGTLQTVDGFVIYPQEYFNPIGDVYGGKPKISEKTYSIHHYDGSWFDGDDHILFEYRKRFGVKRGSILFCLRHPIKAVKKRSRNVKTK